MIPIGTHLRRLRRNPVDPASLLFIGGAAFVLWLIGGKKKKRRPPGVITGPCVPPNCKIPPPSTGPSDPLPPGSGGGHLPKGGGYRPPPGMKTNEVWVSDDCQAFIYGSEWFPVAGDKDAYQWFVDFVQRGDPDCGDWWSEYFQKRALEEGLEGTEFVKGLKLWTWHVEPGDAISGFFPGRFASWPSEPAPNIPQTIPEPTFAFAEEVLAELAPQCAPPRWQDYEDSDEWIADYTAWRRQFPRMALLFDQAMALGAEGPLPVGQNLSLATNETYEGVRNMWNAHIDQVGATKGHIEIV